ncbi:MAG: biopolymer transporter ExbD [Cellvibrionales bacterium]|nr:biopolymer transporter ExbD [Cellvibrionales bacterium]
MPQQRQAEDDQQIDLTPMLDVVFIMLIFFIVTATFIKLPGTDVLRPEALNAEDQKPAMLAAIDDNGQIWINREQVEPRFLKTRIAVLYAENPKGDLVIQADQEARVLQIAQVADAAREVGVESINIAAESR